MHLSMFIHVVVSRDLHRLANQRLSEASFPEQRERCRLKLGKVARGSSDFRALGFGKLQSRGRGRLSSESRPRFKEA
jgi:hypothetical protein